MAHKIYIGIDNGVTGTIGWVGENLCPGIWETPVKSEQSYTKEKKNITRINAPALEADAAQLAEYENEEGQIANLQGGGWRPGKGWPT